MQDVKPIQLGDRPLRARSLRFHRRQEENDEGND